MTKKQNFQNLYTKFVEWPHKKIVFQMSSLSMVAVQMNLPFVSFQYHDLKVLCELYFLKVFCELYFQANRDFQKNDH